MLAERPALSRPTWLGSPKNGFRFGLVVVFWSLAYVGVLQTEVRPLYAEWDKLFHALVFAGVWFSLSWSWRSSPWLISVACLLLGLFAEVHQFWMPGFDPSWRDGWADVMGIAAAHGVSAWRHSHCGTVA
jgi:VanZ family protein